MAMLRCNGNTQGRRVDLDQLMAEHRLPRREPAENQGGLVDADQASGGEAHPGLAMLNLAIDGKRRGCDAFSLKVEDMAPHSITVDRATVRRRKTGHSVAKLKHLWEWRSDEGRTSV
jgi:hypothetical protein